jgi:uncharacterized protein YdhG (YjbR/CyaY superfamily)
MRNSTISNIDDYHKHFPRNVQEKLEQLRKAIIQAAPKAQETISYGMPAFKQHKVLVYYAAYKAHIGFYPTPNAIVAYSAELTKYKTSKGAIQFPLDAPLPISLIKKLVKFRVQEDAQKPLTSKSSVERKPSNRLLPEIAAYSKKLATNERAICDSLTTILTETLKGAENKVWHGHPVWFLDGNPIAGYSKQKPGIRLMFWSGASFDEPGLNVVGQKFKDASIFYNEVSEINVNHVKRWLKKANDIQWDYKNIVKRRGVLVRI